MPLRRCGRTLLVLLACLAARGDSDPDYGRVPLAFVPNRGQADAAVRFTAKGLGLTAYFSAGEVVVDLRGTAIRMRNLGANAAPRVDGVGEQEGRANFLIGDDPRQWRTDVPLYGAIVYRDLYPGVDMLYSSAKRLLKSEYVVWPGGDAARIRIAYEGAGPMRVDEAGALLIETGAGLLREEPPEVYQLGLDREPVAGAFRVSGSTVSFDIGEYDRTRPLFIDPVISYSTYLGGSGTERAHAIAVDATGAAYVTGYTDSSNFPVSAGAYRTSPVGSVDVFVTKLNAAGSAIVYSTYLGGTGDDRGFSIAVSAAGAAYITGYTGSNNFPVVSAMQGFTAGGGRDAFVAQLNAAGTGLTYSTYLGGSGTDAGNGIAVDGAGAAYITGSTASTDFPRTGAYQATFGGSQDAFVTKLNAAGSARVYSTYLGGALDDRGSAIAVDAAGTAYVTGNTSSTNFPTFSALQPANGGAGDAFVSKLSASGLSLTYSTYLGGSGAENMEIGRSIAVDASGSAYVAGSTASANFPTLGAIQAINAGGGNDAFVVKLTPAGSAMSYGTYLGGASIDFGQAIAVDATGSAYVAGYTSSSDFPSVNAGQPAIGGNYDVFVTKLNAAGNAAAASGFLGGAGADAGYGIAIDAGGAAYVTGQTLSSNFPVLGAVQSSGGGSLAAFAARFTFGTAGPPTAVSVSPATGSGAAQAFTLVYNDPRGFADINWVEMNWNATSATSGGCYLRYERAANTLRIYNDAGTVFAASAAMGTAGTLQNSQCVVNAGASSAAGSGSSLTLVLALTFKQSFTGLKNVYMRVQDAAGTLTAWQSRGAWTVAATPATPVSVTPASGSGLTQTFSLVYTSPYGFADINVAQAHVGTELVGAGVCYLQYTRATNTIQLVNDTGGDYAGSAAIGSAGTLTNSQCTLDAAASTAVSAGNDLTLNLALTFKGPFSGAKVVSMGVSNGAGVFSGWQALGGWNVPVGGSLPPVAVSATPASGSGSSQTFSLLFSDPAGFADISWVQVHFQTTLVGQNACFLQYTRASNIVQLVNDSGGNYSGSAAIGSAGTLNNSQCTLDAGASSAVASGTTLTLNLALIFKPGFAGAKTVSIGVTNNANTFSGWQARGVWTVTAAITLPPANVSVTPSAGTGSTQTFSFVFSDVYGFADVDWVQMHLGTTLVAGGSCYLQYTRATNTVQMLNDAGSGYVSTGGTLGGSGTLANSQCSLNLSSSSATGAGNNLTVNVTLSFTLPFAGAKTVSMGAINNGGIFSGWQAKGTWTATGTGNQPPVNVSVTPSSGSGLTQTFSFVYSSPYGFADISWVQMHFGASLVAAGSCYGQYTRLTNTVQLFNNTGTGYVGSGGVLGTAGTLSNSQCAINLASSSATGAGNNLTVSLAITFNAGFSGAKGTSLGVINNAGVFSGWQGLGTWTVP